MISDAAAKNLTNEHLYDLSKSLTGPMQASPGRFTTYGKNYKIEALEFDNIWRIDDGCHLALTHLRIYWMGEALFVTPEQVHQDGAAEVGTR